MKSDFLQCFVSICEGLAWGAGAAGGQDLRAAILIEASPA